ncbi:glycosyl transferase, group 1 [Caballeronia arationis]|jgi:glycosyltransferase involved in cell wall biosynthesis|uniref:Glycosyltransferase involved in cell wall bisynthesis n=1 Tax=Caballeronia arationis TaxID=1777142 RepID=A0A7Z7N6C9_9BURK|nr:glycosyltransferase family 4 protein [Caballeronia arationis]SAK63522.1 glycosyl transferase, group 1 [Caballeronia arationis]SOE88752.1 Glycosyltransferase involved in cell wall bisynthesis [Caballeronia arationis]
MKVLIANTLYYPDVVGGAEVSTQLLAEGLAAAGVDVTVVCATGTGVDHISKLNGVKIWRLRFANVYWPHRAGKRSRVAKLVWHAIDTHNLIMARKLKAVVAREKPDLVSTSNLSCLSVDLWRIAKNAGLPVVHTTRDYYLLCPAATMLSNNRSCERQCTLCACYAGHKRTQSEKVDIAIGVSRFVLQKHLDNGFFAGASSTGVISDCHFSDVGAPPVSSAPSVKDAVRLGMLGRISPEKGIELLIDELMKDTSLNWKLTIGGTGDGDYVASLKARYNDPRVRFLGHVDASSFLRELDVLVVPSRWNEPFGRVIVEAYSQGIPVVGANTGGIPEVIEPTSHLVFDINEPRSVIERIHDAIEMARDPETHDRLLRYADSFSPDRMVAAYLKVYSDALKQSATKENHEAQLHVSSE